MRVRSVLWISLMGLWFAMSSQVFAQGGPGRDRRGPAGPGQGRCGEEAAKIMESLNLSADQKKTLDRLREQMQTSMKTKHDEMEKLQKQLHDPHGKEVKDSDLKALRERMQMLQNEAMTAQLDHMKKVEAVMTPEQKKKWDEAREHLKSTCGGMGGPHHP